MVIRSKVTVIKFSVTLAFGYIYEVINRQQNNCYGYKIAATRMSIDIISVLPDCIVRNVVS